MTQLAIWLAMLQQYEIWCLDMGYCAIDEFTKSLNEFWESQ